jgi:tetratricopeptide (TPR) repeat protein
MTPLSRSLFAVSLCLAFAGSSLVPSSALAEDEPEPEAAAAAEPMKIEAEKHFNLAKGHYQAEEYKDAARELSLAHKIEPRTNILFAWAQAERLAGNCDGATKLYHRLRKAELADQDRLGVLEGLERCGAFEEADKTQKKAEKLARSGSPWYSDWLGDTLLVTGVVGLGVGASFYQISGTERDDAMEAFVYETHKDLEARAKTHRQVSILAFSVGGALIAGSIARYITRDNGARKGAEEAPLTVTGWMGKDSGGFALGGPL